jgi:hypothetical protein
LGEPQFRGGITCGDGLAGRDGKRMLMARYSKSTKNWRSVRDVGNGCAGLGVMVSALLLTFELLTLEAFAQPATTNLQDANSTPPAAAAPPPNSTFQPGFIDAFGRFIGDSAAKLNSQFNSHLDTLGELGNQTSDAAKNAVKSAVENAAKNAVGAAKDTAGAIAGLPGARFADGRERCAVATNGAADCHAAADAVCRGKGFTAGKILDTRSEQKCPARVWLSGHLPAEGECPLETFVTRAVCQ